MYISYAYMVEMITTRFSHRIILIVRGILTICTKSHYWSITSLFLIFCFATLDDDLSPYDHLLLIYEGDVFYYSEHRQNWTPSGKVIKRSSQTLRHLICYCAVSLIMFVLASISTTMKWLCSFNFNFSRVNFDERTFTVVLSVLPFLTTNWHCLFTL